uniref:Secreted protein C n=1 Tax=Mayetiola destructor TaxID=39758 RepID=D1MLN4_MAYDE|nr:secreted protein C [Mayetiola destructor]
MCFISGLAVFLVLFEGIIIKCDATGATTSVTPIEHSPNIDIKGDLKLFPQDVIEEILIKTDIKTIRNVVRERMIHPNDIRMNRILQNYIFIIGEDFDHGDGYDFYAYEFKRKGELFVEIYKHKNLMAFFDKFGHHVKKLKIKYFFDEDVCNLKTILYILKICAKNLEDLRICSYDDSKLWEEILNEKNGINFPNVKKFKFMGKSNRNELKLNLIFPKLESFKLCGAVKDVNCLAYVTGLQEFTLSEHERVANNIPEHQLKDIFKNNKNMTKISLICPNSRETIDSIAKYLTKLETLEVDLPGYDFLLRANDSVALYELPSVTSFVMSFYDFDERLENTNLSFHMPNLKSLTVNLIDVDDNVVKFFQRFKKLETLELLVRDFNVVGYIEDVVHIKEFITGFCDDIGFESVKEYFFDGIKSKLQTLKFVNFDEGYYPFYKNSIKLINDHLIKTNQSTWTISMGEDIQVNKQYLQYDCEPSLKYLMFRRNL